jgi:hypothetical protein
MDTNSRNIHTACNMAEELVELQMGDRPTWSIDHFDGSESLTEDAQDLFNDIYHIVMIHLEKHDQ